MKTAKLPPVAELEAKVNDLAVEAEVNPAVWDKFMGYLARLKAHNLEMYAHSLRVGIYAYQLAQSENFSDARYALFGGCGHDYGKSHISNRLLNAKHLSNRGYEKIKNHAAAGFNDLKEQFLFTAYIAGLHHHGGDHGYGIELEKESPIPLKDDMVQRIHDTAAIVQIADYFDALTTRNNNKGLVKNIHDMNEVSIVMREHFTGAESRVRWLIQHKL